jgi:hypothetical protein
VTGGRRAADGVNACGQAREDERRERRGVALARQECCAETAGDLLAFGDDVVTEGGLSHYFVNVS